MNRGTDKEDVRQVVELRLADVWLLEDVTVESQVPALGCPIGVPGNIQDLCWQCADLAVIEAKTALHAGTRGEVWGHCVSIRSCETVQAEKSTLKVIRNSRSYVARDIGAQTSQDRAYISGKITDDAPILEGSGGLVASRSGRSSCDHRLGFGYGCSFGISAINSKSDCKGHEGEDGGSEASE